MEDATSVEVIADLNDLELAILVCLVANEHCVIRVDPPQLVELQTELVTTCENTFGLSCTNIHCDDKTTLEGFADGVINDTTESQDDPSLPGGPASGVHFTNMNDQPNLDLDSRTVFNVVIATGLETAVRKVQIQALELMRTRRIYTRKAIHATPKRFLFISLIPLDLPGPPFFNPHLNDRFFISHVHDDRAEFATPPGSPKSVSSSRHAGADGNATFSVVTEQMLSNLQKLTEVVGITAEIRRYTHDITSFMRMHRAVAGGVSAVASRQLGILTCILAPMHGLSYVTPSLVSLAARKVYPHRIQIATAETERSMQWGSDKIAVEAYLANMTPVKVIDEILEQVEVPL